LQLRNMSSIDPEHLNRTLAHPLLKTIFQTYTIDIAKQEHVLELWEDLSNFSLIYDDIWLRIRANSIFQKYVVGNLVAIPPQDKAVLQEAIRQRNYSKDMFKHVQQFIFERYLRESLRAFLQSDSYHQQYERLRRASLFVLIQGIDNLNISAKLHCKISYEDQEILTEKFIWPTDKLPGTVHRLDIVAVLKNEFHITIFAENQSIWQKDEILGVANVRLSDIWDEKPRELIRPLTGNLQYANTKIIFGTTLMHRPAPGISVGELDFLNPLATCCSYGHIKAVQQLLNEGVPIETRMEDSRRSPLHVAVLKNRANITQLLLHHQADPNSVDNNCQTPLHLAALCAPDLCYMLVTAGADVNVKELFENGKSPLHILATQNYADAMRYLIEKGANINARSLDGLTPLHQAVAVQSVDCINVLLEFRADVNLKNEKGVTPVALATLKKAESPAAREVFRLLTNAAQGQ